MMSRRKPVSYTHLPPSAEPVDGISVYMNHTLDPALLVRTISDYSEVTVTYAENPDFTREGDV